VARHYCGSDQNLLSSSSRSLKFDACSADLLEKKEALESQSGDLEYDIHQGLLSIMLNA
jgi:hypothetical protein